MTITNLSIFFVFSVFCRLAVIRQLCRFADWRQDQGRRTPWCLFQATSHTIRWRGLFCEIRISRACRLTALVAMGAPLARGPLGTVETTCRRRSRVVRVALVPTAISPFNDLVGSSPLNSALPILTCSPYASVVSGSFRMYDIHSWCSLNGRTPSNPSLRMCGLRIVAVAYLMQHNMKRTKRSKIPRNIRLPINIRTLRNRKCGCFDVLLSRADPWKSLWTGLPMSCPSAILNRLRPAEKKSLAGLVAVSACKIARACNFPIGKENVCTF